MEVLFDLQHELNTLDLNSSNLIVPAGDNPPTLKVSVVDDVRTILVKDRPERVSGLGINLKELSGLQPGDRITVTGRIPRETSPGSWGVALIAEQTDSRKDEECQLTMQVSPRALFSLNHILGEDDLQSLLMVQTTRWGATDPVMNFNIDSILISHSEKINNFTEDPRKTVYSFEIDEELVAGDANPGGFATNVLVQSGSPGIKILQKDGRKQLYLSERGRDFDGVDVNLGALGLVKGNKYQITVTGRTVGNAMRGAKITLQAIPGFSWRAGESIEVGGNFTLIHMLTFAEVTQWKTARITTNLQGASVPFYIHGIEVKRLGLL
ncbi:MAG: hypothetical protein FWC70_11360 [Defluviitaleaceae bacterium]|nr:hypothetical protein [Defluviitaleaceae bacterium]